MLTIPWIDFKSEFDKLSNNLKSLLALFSRYGYEGRIVGGAVRDMLMGIAPRDIDICVNCEPYMTEFLLQEKFKMRDDVTVWNRIKHGTVKVEFSENEMYEITSLGFKIEMVKNTIEISGLQDWEEDAKGRDFTANALSVDMDGKLYDYVGGVQDIKHQRIEFQGDFKQQLKHEPLLMLRFFKLIAKFPEPSYKREIIDFLKENNKKFVSQIKEETVEWYMANIKKQPYHKNALLVMQECGFTPPVVVRESFDVYFKKVQIF
jgi:tRNA nucleotidyltransferase/poly(A) polymerase